MKIGAKITAGFLVVILMMAISGGVSYYLLNIIHDESEKFQEERIPQLERTYMLAINTAWKAAAARGFIVTGNQTFLDDFVKLEKEDDGIVDELLKHAITAQGKRFPQEIKNLDAAYKKLLFEKAVPLRKEGKLDEAIRVMGAEMAPAAAATRKKIDEYAQFRVKQMDRDFDLMQAHMKQGQFTVVVSVVIALLAGIGIAYAITRSVTRPLKATTAQLGVMANGDYTRDIDRAFLARKDEFGTMAAAFDKLTRSMREIIRHISQSSDLVASSSEELTASAHQSADASASVAQSIQQVAAGSEKQVQAVNDTSAVVEEISATLEEVAATANEMASLAEKTTKATQDGQTSADRAVSQMASVGQEAKEAQKAAEELKAGSQQIGEIVGLISSIAGQTNLLALNAAIEAARAGEAGRGFAVVAEEVRKLAEQSEDAARRITELIGKNNTSIVHVVGTIDTAISAVGQGVELVNVAGGNFRDIGSLVKQVAQQVADISKAIHEAAVGSQRIVASIRDVETLSREAATESQSVSAATEEQSASMEQIASSSQALAKLAEELQASVSKFKI